MKKQPHLLAKLWESYPDAIASQYSIPENVLIAQYLAEMLAIGPFYYYIINIGDYSIFHVHKNLLTLHGTTTYPTTVKDIIDYIHPDDIDFVFEAEKATLLTMQEIGFGKGILYRTSYCFRMKTADSSYHLFHHQRHPFKSGSRRTFYHNINIYTGISHLSTKNNYIATVIGFNGRSDCHQIDLSNQPTKNKISCLLTKRELEFLPYIAQGLSSAEIAQKLEISQLTVRVHRKNILRKTNTRNSTSLIKRCMELDLLLYAHIVDVGFVSLLCSISFLRKP